MNIRRKKHTNISTKDKIFKILRQIGKKHQQKYILLFRNDKVFDKIRALTRGDKHD